MLWRHDYFKFKLMIHLTIIIRANEQAIPKLFLEKYWLALKGKYIINYKKYMCPILGILCHNHKHIACQFCQPIHIFYLHLKCLNHFGDNWESVKPIAGSWDGELR